MLLCWNQIYEIDLCIFQLIFIYIYFLDIHTTIPELPGSILWIEKTPVRGTDHRAHVTLASDEAERWLLHRWGRSRYWFDPWNATQPVATQKYIALEHWKCTHIFVGCFVAILFAFQRPHMRLDSKQPELFQIWGLLQEFIGYCVNQSSIDSS